MTSEQGLRNFTTKEEINLFLNEYKPTNYQDAILAPTPKIERIIQVYGSDYASAIVAVNLTEISTMLAFAITPEMISTSSDLIIERWPDLKVSDILHFKKLVLNGSIGKKLFRLDVRVFCELFEEYYLNRLDVFDTLRQRKQDEELIGEVKQYSIEQIREFQDKLKKEAEQKQIIKNYKKEVQLKELPEICIECGVSFDEVSEAIRSEAETQFADGIDGMTFETFLAIKMNAVLIQARKDNNYLSELINSK